MKKLLSILMCFVLIVSTLTFVSIPASAASYSGTCGDDLTWSLDTSTGVLEITGSGNMKDYSSFSVPWYSYRSYIKTVTIGDSVTSIGDYAFYYCSKLTSVTIGNSVKSIGDDAFYECKSLTSVTIPDSVTSIGEDAFGYCKSLTSITIPNSVTSIGSSAFFYCSSLTSVNITDIKSWCEIDFDSCFSNPLYYAKELYLNGELLKGDLIISGGTKSIGDYAFYRCTSLTSIIIPDSVTSIGEDAFYNCSSLTSVNITDIKSWCEIDFDSYSSNPLYYAKKLYLNGELLKGDLIIPGGTKSIGDYAFYYCSKLTSVTIGNSVKSIGDDAFYYCKSLTSVTIPDSVTSIGEDAFAWCESLTGVTMPDSVTSIGDSAFLYCSNLVVNVNCNNSYALNYLQNNSVNNTLIHNFGVLKYDENEHWYKCSRCDETDNHQSHEFINYKSNKDATCLENGTETAKCERCDETHTRTEQNSALGHEFVNYKSNKDATCLENGTETAKCEACDETNTRIEQNSALGHDYSVLKYDSNEHWYKCSRCDETNNYTEHFGGTATCEEKAICLICSQKYGESLGHDFTVLKYDENEHWYKCSRCDATDNHQAHEFINYKSNKDATCLENGTETSKCECCDETHTRDISNSALGHEFANYISDNNATCTKDATETSKCSRCDVTHTRDISNSALGHNFVNYISNKDATCLKNGTETSKCSRCDVTHTRDIGNSALGHDYSVFEYNTTAYWYKCSRCTSTSNYTTQSGGTSGGLTYSVYNLTATITYCDNSVTGRLVIPEKIGLYTVVAIESQAFYNCNYLTSVSIPKTVTNIGNVAFAYCSSLTSISVDAANEYYCSVDGVLFNKDKTTLIQYPVGNTRTSYTIPNTVTAIADKAFLNCLSLVDLSIGSGVTNIGYLAFAGCSSLNNITVDSNNKNFCSENGVLFNKEMTTLIQYPIGNSRTFYIIPNGVEKIGAGAFADCSVITSVTIPQTVVIIEELAFSGCRWLAYVYYDGNSVWWNRIAISTGNNYLTTAMINYNHVHSYTAEITEKPTCTQEGSQLNTCACGHSYSSSIAAIGHTEVVDKAVAPTCTATGLAEGKHCSVCNTVLVEQKVVVAKGHTVSSVWEVVTPATETQEGQQVKKCTVCGAVIESVQIAKLQPSTQPTNQPTNQQPTNQPSTNQPPANVPSVCTHDSNKIVVKDTKAATYFATGYSGDKVCGDCGGLISQGSVISKLNLNVPKFKLIKGKKQFKVKYTKVAGATGFQVRYKLKGKWTTKTFATKKNATKAIKKLKKGTYQVQIRAFVQSGKQKAYSAWSKTQKVKVK